MWSHTSWFQVLLVFTSSHSISMVNGERVLGEKFVAFVSIVESSIESRESVQSLRDELVIWFLSLVRGGSCPFSCFL